MQDHQNWCGNTSLDNTMLHTITRSLWHTFFTFIEHQRKPVQITLVGLDQIGFCFVFGRWAAKQDSEQPIHKQNLYQNFQNRWSDFNETYHRIQMLNDLVETLKSLLSHHLMNKSWWHGDISTFTVDSSYNIYIICHKLKSNLRQW